MKKCLILANGEVPKKSDLIYLQRRGYESLICADGGANSAKIIGLVPDYIIGDLDSAETETLKFFNKKSEIIKYTRQNDTDVEKAIKLAIKLKFTNTILLGATGDRLDHSFCNIGIAVKFNDKIDISILHNKSFLKVYSGNIELKTSPGETISIYGFDHNTRVTSKGLIYPLKKSKLPFGQKESTSNVAKGVNVNLKIENGKMLVIREFSELKRNGFFG